MSIPDGVHKFSGVGVQQSNKGKFQPDSINAGRSGNTSGSGKAANPKMGKGSAGATPAGVHRHSGTEDMGAKVKHLNAAKSGPGKHAGANAVPEGVRKFKGTSV